MAKEKAQKKYGLAKKVLLDQRLFADQSLLYTLWIILRKDSDIKSILSWTGFFINLDKNLAVKPSSIGYLDCLNAPVTEMYNILYDGKVNSN